MGTRGGVRIFVGGTAPEAREFAEVVVSLCDVMDEVAEHFGFDAPVWGVTHAATGSVSQVLEGPGMGEVEEVVIAGIAAIGAGVRELPDGWTVEAARRLSRFRLPHGREVRVGPGDARRRQYVVSQTTCRNARALAASPSRSEFAGVTGWFDRPALHTSTGIHRVELVERDLTTSDEGRRVRLEVPARLFAQVPSLWSSSRLVEASGWVERRPDGLIRSVEVEQIEVFGDEVPFGSIAGLLKDDPGFDPAEHLARVRGRA